MSLRLSAEEYAALRKQILDRDGWKCRSCRSRNALHVHHVVFRSQQGDDAEENLVTLCNQCHDAVHRSDLRIEAEYFGFKFFRENGWRPQ